MKSIPDPYYNKIIQTLVDFYVISFILILGLCKFNILSINICANIVIILIGLFCLTCIYDACFKKR